MMALTLLAFMFLHVPFMHAGLLKQPLPLLNTLQYYAADVNVVDAASSFEGLRGRLPASPFQSWSSTIFSNVF